jgi:hypothetical protein
MFGIFYLLACVYVGFLCARVLKISTVEQLLVGVLSGLLIGTWSSFLLYIPFRNLAISFWGSFAFVLILAIFLAPRFGVPSLWWKRLPDVLMGSLVKNKLLGAFFILVFLFFSFMFSSYVWSVRSDGWYAGINSWGDTPFHFALINHFVHGAGTFEYPIFAGEKLTYPFLFDFFTAVLDGPGWLDLRFSFILLGVLLAMVFVLSIYVLAFYCTQKRSAAVLTLILFLVGGGVGFAYYVKDSIESGSFSVEKDYAHKGDIQLNWGNVVLDYMLPQRTFLMGFPVTVMILVLFRHWLFVKKRKEYLLYAGFLASMLPMVHSHSWMSAGIMGAGLALLSLSWDWLYFFIPSGLLSIPQIAWIKSRVTDDFIRMHIGWTSQASSLFDFVVFWLRNTGFILVLGIAGFFLLDKQQRKFLLPTWILFILGNVMIFQPWDFDNMKFMLFWWLALCIASSILLLALEKRGLLGKFLFVVLLVGALASGVLALKLGMTARFHWWSPDEIQLGAWIRDNTPRDAIFLSSDYHNNLIYGIAGRRVVMGFGGWVWSHGIKAGDTGAHVEAMLQGRDNAKELLKKYGVDYVAIGPAERAKGANDEFYRQFKLVRESANFKIYDVQSS